MRYVKIRDVDPAHIRQGLDNALKEQNIEVDDLLRRLGYIHLKDGRRHYAQLREDGEDLLLLRRITDRLGLDHEALSGERPFADYDDYLEFTFVPVLLRVPTNTRPGQIFTVMFAGLKPSIQVDTFPELINASEEERNRIIAPRIRADYAEKKRSSFGDTIGYAFYHAFCQASAYSVDGEPLPDFDIVPVTIGINVRTNRSALASRGGIIPRLKCRATGEVYTTLPERPAANQEPATDTVAGAGSEATHAAGKEESLS